MAVDIDELRRRLARERDYSGLGMWLAVLDELEALREVRDAAVAVEEVLFEQENISVGIGACIWFPALDDLRIALEKARG